MPGDRHHDGGGSLLIYQQPRPEDSEYNQQGLKRKREPDVGRNQRPRSEDQPPSMVRVRARRGRRMGEADLTQ